MQQTNMLPSHSPIMLRHIKGQLRGPYSITQLEQLREYYEKKNSPEVVQIIEQEISRRKG